MATKQPKITAKDLVQLLADRHAGDVFVSECKDGQTHGRNHIRMDAWALKRSYSSPCTTAHEIKVARSDFLQDDKWPGYLHLCNEFYFVCPFGLISKAETPEKAGLIYATKNGQKLRTVKKAPWRDVEIPESLYLYVLISRAQIERAEYTPPETLGQLAYWTQWLADKEHAFIIGRSVSKELHERVSTRITKVEAENDRLSREIKRIEGFRDKLRGMGIEDYHRPNYLHMDSLLDNLTGIPDSLIRDLTQLSARLKTFKDDIIDDAKNHVTDATSTREGRVAP